MLKYLPQVEHLGGYRMNDWKILLQGEPAETGGVTFHVNSASGISIDRLQKSGWNNALMAPSGEVRFSDVRQAVGNKYIDIAGTVAFRTQIEKKAGVTKQHANRLMKELVKQPFIKLFGGQPVSCVSTIDAW